MAAVAVACLETGEWGSKSAGPVESAMVVPTDGFSDTLLVFTTVGGRSKC